jgi:hypothetical protein
MPITEGVMLSDNAVRQGALWELFAFFLPGQSGGGAARPMPAEGEALSAAGARLRGALHARVQAFVRRATLHDSPAAAPSLVLAVPAPSAPAGSGGTTVAPVLARATRDYGRAEAGDDAAAVYLARGDLVYVTRGPAQGSSSGSGGGGESMWYGVVNGEAAGRFPASHVKLLDADEVRCVRTHSVRMHS